MVHQHKSKDESHFLLLMYRNMKRRSGRLVGNAVTSAPPFLVHPLVSPTAGARHQKCPYVLFRFRHYIPGTSVQNFKMCVGRHTSRSFVNEIINVGY